MLNSLLNIFKSVEEPVKEDGLSNLKLLCGLMIEAANTDGIVSTEEVNKISSVLINIFKENPIDVEKIIKMKLAEKDEPTSLYFYTSKINKNFSSEKKLLLIETLWEIILSDGKIHDFESNLIRRLAGLLYLSDFDCGNAKKKAIKKINIKDNN